VIGGDVRAVVDSKPSTAEDVSVQETTTTTTQESTESESETSDALSYFEKLASD